MLSIPCDRHTLGNGLRIVLSPDPGAPIVAVNIWYDVGSGHERPGRTGLAHLFEHLMFQGSLNVPKNGYFEHMERVGGSSNATTWFDRTNYYSVTPPERLELALWLEADRMGWMLPTLDRDRLENQRQVVLAEKREHYDNRPYGDWVERILPMVFPEGHPYSHPVIGLTEDIEAASLADVHDFFGLHYRPSNAVLTVAGHFDAGYALDAVERYFGEIGDDAVPDPAPGPECPRAGPVIGEELSCEVEAAVPLPRVFFAARTPPVADPGFATVEVASALLGTGRAGLLRRRLVRERRVASSASAHVIPLRRDAGTLMASATGFADTAPTELESALVEELEALSQVETSEVERALAMCESGLLRAMESVATRADILSMFELYFDDPARVNRELDRVRSVTVEDVREFARNLLIGSNRALITYRPKP